MYDEQNVFAKIIRHEIAAKIIYEDEILLAFHDIAPIAPIHILVVPKGAYQNYNDFVVNASAEHLQHFFKMIEKIAINLDIYDNYQLITNIGSAAGQVIFHFHMHIISKKQPTKLN